MKTSYIFKKNFFIIWSIWCNIIFFTRASNQLFVICLYFQIICAAQINCKFVMKFQIIKSLSFHKNFQIYQKQFLIMIRVFLKFLKCVKSSKFLIIFQLSFKFLKSRLSIKLLKFIQSPRSFILIVLVSLKLLKSQFSIKLFKCAQSSFS